VNRDEFADLLKRFAGRPVPATAGRHVYIWQASFEELASLVPAKLISSLDLHELCRTLERTPNTTDAARQVIVEALDAWLTREFPRDDRQRLLTVSGCDLLARYRVPLSHFMRLSSESRMVVFLVPGEDSRYKSLKPLPAYIRVQPETTLAYFKPQLAEDAVIGERSR
jgi:hypothetical protein